MKSLKNLAAKAGRKATEAGLIWLSYAQLNPVYAADDVPGGITSGVNQADQGGPRRLFTDNGVFDRVVSAILFLVGAISVVMLIVGGIRFIFSAGNADRVKGAQNTIIYALIGLAVAILAYAIVQFIIGQLGGSDTVGT